MQHPISAVAVALVKQHSFDPDIAYLSAWYSQHSEMPKASWYQMVGYLQKVKRVPVITEADAAAMLRNYTRGR